jgi:hypothetical protein
MNPESYQNSCDEPESRPAQVREIGPTRRSVSGQFAFRGDCAIPFESTLERDFLVRCEFQLSVLDVIPQPVEVPFRGERGSDYTYTPDFLVYYRLGSRSHVDYPRPMLVEVKPEDQWRQNWRKWSGKWKAARRYAQNQGWTFRVFDETRIRDTVFQNIRFLERYKRMNYDPADSEQLVHTVLDMGSCRVGYLLTRHFPGIYQATGVAHVWHLVAARKLDCDISIPLSNSTELWVPNYDH